METTPYPETHLTTRGVFAPSPQLCYILEIFPPTVNHIGATPSMLTITPVQSEADKRAFYRLAWRVYHYDPYWVPHLWPQRKAYLDGREAFFSFGEGAFWLARQGGEVVGTIGMAIDHSRNHNRGERNARFGFFEVLPGRYDVAQAMWDHACRWARERGMTALHGPYSFTTNEEPGFLVAGHETTQSIMMGHTPPYYAEYAQDYGFEKEIDTLAYRLEMSALGPDLVNVPAIFHRAAERARRRYGENVLRHPDPADWDREVERLHPVYNRSLATLEEFSPIELAEFRSQALALKPIIDPDLVLIAEIEGEPVGFGLGLVNIAEAFRHANGLRRPWYILRLALARRRITGVSFKIMAMDPAYRGRGIESMIFLEMARAVMRKGYTWLDASLTSETNPTTNKIAARVGAAVYRRYRIYRLGL